MPGESASSKQSDPSLSFDKQPALKALVTELVSGTGPITIFCGAGTSVDSGLPTWVGLLWKMAQSVPHDGVRKLILAEPDIKRSAQFMMDQLKSALGDDHKIATALYDGAATSAGQLAASIAKLCRLLGDRVRIMTTNYDDRLELALIAEFGDPAAVSVFGLDEVDAWRAASGAPILHVHGFLPSEQLREKFAAKNPLVLTEGQYLHSGEAVQKVVHEQLVDTRVIFIGASMADSSVVYPLSETYSTTPIKRPTALLVPDVEAAAKVTNSGADNLAREHLSKFAEYLRGPLQTDVIELKSFGQVAQCVGELSAALETGADYLSDDATKSPRYGFRFQRILNEVHGRVGMVGGELAPAWDNSAKISQRLFDAFEQGPKAVIASQIDSRDYDGLGIPEDYFANEGWALELWLRTSRPEPRVARYELVLAGSSAFSRRESRSLAQRSDISPLSVEVAARSIYRGSAFIASVTPTSEEQTAAERFWPTHSVVPLALSETSLGMPSTTEQRVTIGAVVLRSDRRLDSNVKEWTHKNPVSVLSTMDGTVRKALLESVLKAGIDAIS